MRMPAARIGDMHLCPQLSGVVPHVGGPILPKCEPTVLTGMIPQARVGDMCTCAGGPPDSIAMGASFVLVGGMPAARMLDPTLHGGRIILGCFTVLIGDDGGGGAVASAIPGCAELALVHDDAILANHTYGENPKIPDGYRALDPVANAEELANLGVDPELLDANRPGFRAEIFARGDPPNTHYTVAFRGTADGADIETDVMQAVGMETDHYDRAMEMARNVDVGSGGNCSFVGHSLGGGLASAASITTGRPARTFNAAGVSNRTITRETGRYPEGEAPVDAYYIPGDALSGTQDNRGMVLGGLAVGVGLLAGPLAGLGLAGWMLSREMGDSPLVPAAYGRRHELPGMVAPGMTDWAGNRHRMTSVLAAIEEQQRQMGCI